MLEDEKLKTDIGTLQHDLVRMWRPAFTDRYSKLYQFLIHETDLDLLADWETKIVSPWGDGPILIQQNWLLRCPDVDSLRFLERRQLKYAKGTSLQQPADLLNLDYTEAVLKIEQGLPALLLAHQIKLDLRSLARLGQGLKEWLLFAIGLSHSVYHYKHRRFSDGHSSTDVLRSLLQLGVSPSAIVYHSSVLQHIMISSSYFTQYGPDNMHRWVETLHKVGTNLFAYGQHEHQLYAELLSELSLNVDGHHVTVQSFTYGLTPADWQFTFTVSHQTRFWSEHTVPGQWLEDDFSSSKIYWTSGNYFVPGFIEGRKIWGPASTMNESALRSHLGSASYELVEPTQDDHGIVYRSFMRRSRTYGRQQRRSSSQPRSLKGTLWRTRGTELRPWLERCHLCPLLPQRMLHIVDDETPYRSQLGCCAQGIFDHGLPWWHTHTHTHTCRVYLSTKTLDRRMQGIQIVEHDLDCSTKDTRVQILVHPRHQGSYTSSVSEWCDGLSL